MMMVMIAIFGLSIQSCDPDPEPETPNIHVYTSPSFSAANISVTGDSVLKAKDSKIIISLNYTVTLTIDGVPQVFTGSCKSNELPVMAGNDVEISADFDDNAASSYMCFTMPDGSKHIITKATPNFKWAVPSDFIPGAKIVAQWADNSGKILHESLSSYISLIEFAH